MKIVHFISNLGKGGAERLVVDLCNRLSENKNHEVLLCVFYERDGEATFKKEVSEKVRYINLDKSGRLNSKFQRKVFSFLKREKPDVVNSHLSGTALYMYLPALYFSKIKFFHTIHNLAAEETPNKNLRTLRRFIYRTKRLKPISISKITQDSHNALYAVNSDLIYNGVKKQAATGEYENVKKEISNYKRDNETKVFLSIGRINSPKDQKNFKLLVNVFSKLYHENVNAVLVIIGADTSQEKETLQSLISIKPSNVFFIGQKNNISDYMLNSDFFCLSSRFEGLPITIIEALAQGLPVISTNVGGIPELIEDYKNGLLVSDILNIESYYIKVKELLSWDVNKLKAVKLENIKKYESAFTINNVAENYLQAYLKKS